MQSRIQRRKPALAITAASHAISLENAISPRKTIYRKRLTRDDKRKELRRLSNIEHDFILLRARESEQPRPRKRPTKKAGKKPR